MRYLLYALATFGLYTAATWLILVMVSIRSFLAACAVTSALGAQWISPGAVWYDTDGNKIDAHGGNVVKRGDTFYWIGQAASSK